jgi:hypothetical protein
MDEARTMCNERPYQNKINRKKRAISEREGLDSDEEEVEYLCAMEHIEKILRAMYEIKTKGQGSGAKEVASF